MVSFTENEVECSVCSTAIWRFDGRRLKKTEEYNEVDVRLNNESIMTVGVCSGHTEPTEAELDTITQKAHQGWLEEVERGVGEKSWVKDVGLNLRVVGLA